MKNTNSFKFAFIVHPRTRQDLERKFNFFRYLPNRLIDLFTKYYPPIIISKITGLKSVTNESGIEGYVISVLPTVNQMIENRSLALKRIRQACSLAERKGVRIIGLGGVTSSFSKGGVDLLDNTKVNITTGHAYTGYNIMENVIALKNYMGLNEKQIRVAVVGAAGSIGSISAKLLAREGFSNLILIDLERKKTHFDELTLEIIKINPSTNIRLSHKIADVKDCDIVITATNAPEALILPQDVKWGAIIVDDAQPSDIHPDVFARKDVLVIEAGVTRTPNIFSNFNFGLKNVDDNFCCLAEVLILSANEWQGHYVLNRASLDQVDMIVQMGKKLGFKIATFQNFYESISDEKLSYVKKCIHQHELPA